MNQFIGTIGSKIQCKVTLKAIKEFPSNYGYNNTYSLYIMEDQDGNRITWKTTSSVYFDEGPNKTGYFAKVGDELEFKATVKDHKEYKGTNQTVILRPKFNLLKKAPSYEEIQKAKKQELMATLKDGDDTWTIPYKQYKKHYSDCEVVPGSFLKDHVRCYITIVVRAGRLKASGVRGERFSTYELRNQEGKYISYKAVSEENALRRAQKEFPNDTWEVEHIYNKEFRNYRYLV